MKILLTLLIVTLSTFDISYEKTELATDKIVGSFYSNIYSRGDLDKDLSLVREIPEDFISGKSEYKSEYDVGWKFDFLESGEIKITRLFSYYCGFEVVLLERGQWKKIDENLYKITLNGISYDKMFSSRKKYHLIDSDNGIRRLKINN